MTLVQKAKKGDATAFNQILQSVAIDDKGNNKINRLASKYHYLDEQSDLVQEFKLKIWMAVLMYERKHKIDVETFSWNMIRNWLVDKQRKHFGKRALIVYDSNYVEASEVILEDDYDGVLTNCSTSKLQGDEWKVANLISMGYRKSKVSKMLNCDVDECLNKISKRFAL